MVDDRSSTVSLPEVPLLGVLPGTGGLTRLVDKRKVRRDLADVFCTTAEGVRADRAKAWGLVDRTAPPRPIQSARRRARPRARGTQRPPRRGLGYPAGAARTRDPRARLSLPLGRSRHRAERARRDRDRNGPPQRRGSRRSRADHRGRRRLVAAGDGARVGRRAIDAAREPSRNRNPGAEDPRCRRCRAGRRPDDDRQPSTTGSCARRSGSCAAHCSGSMSPRAASLRSSTRARALPAACWS